MLASMLIVLFLLATVTGLVVLNAASPAANAQATTDATATQGTMTGVFAQDGSGVSYTVKYNHLFQDTATTGIRTTYTLELNLPTGLSLATGADRVVVCSLNSNSDVCANVDANSITVSDNSISFSVLDSQIDALTYTIKTRYNPAAQTPSYLLTTIAQLKTEQKFDSFIQNSSVRFIPDDALVSGGQVCSGRFITSFYNAGNAAIPLAAVVFGLKGQDIYFEPPTDGTANGGTYQPDPQKVLPAQLPSYSPLPILTAGRWYDAITFPVEQGSRKVIGSGETLSFQRHVRFVNCISGLAISDTNYERRMFAVAISGRDSVAKYFPTVTATVATDAPISAAYAFGKTADNKLSAGLGNWLGGTSNDLAPAVAGDGSAPTPWFNTDAVVTMTPSSFLYRLTGSGLDVYQKQVGGTKRKLIKQIPVTVDGAGSNPANNAQLAAQNTTQTGYQRSLAFDSAGNLWLAVSNRFVGTSSSNNKISIYKFAFPDNNSDNLRFDRDGDVISSGKWSFVRDIATDITDGSTADSGVNAKTKVWSNGFTVVRKPNPAQDYFVFSIFKNDGATDSDAGNAGAVNQYLLTYPVQQLQASATELIATVTDGGYNADYSKCIAASAASFPSSDLSNLGLTKASSSGFSVQKFVVSGATPNNFLIPRDLVMVGDNFVVHGFKSKWVNVNLGKTVAENLGTNLRLNGTDCFVVQDETLGSIGAPVFMQSYQPMQAPQALYTLSLLNADRQLSVSDSGKVRHHLTLVLANRNWQAQTSTQGDSGVGIKLSGLQSATKIEVADEAGTAQSYTVDSDGALTTSLENPAAGELTTVHVTFELDANSNGNYNLELANTADTATVRIATQPVAMTGATSQVGRLTLLQTIHDGGTGYNISGDAQDFALVARLSDGSTIDASGTSASSTTGLTAGVVDSITTNNSKWSAVAPSAARANPTGGQRITSNESPYKTAISVPPAGTSTVVKAGTYALSVQRGASQQKALYVTDTWTCTDRAGTTVDVTTMANSEANSVTVPQGGDITCTAQTYRYPEIDFQTKALVADTSPRYEQIGSAVSIDPAEANYQLKYRIDLKNNSDFGGSTGPVNAFLPNIGVVAANANAVINLSGVDSVQWKPNGCTTSNGAECTMPASSFFSNLANGKYTAVRIADDIRVPASSNAYMDITVPVKLAPSVSSQVLDRLSTCRSDTASGEVFGGVTLGISSAGSDWEATNLHRSIQRTPVANDYACIPITVGWKLDVNGLVSKDDASQGSTYGSMGRPIDLEILDNGNGYSGVAEYLLTLTNQNGVSKVAPALNLEDTFKPELLPPAYTNNSAAAFEITGIEYQQVDADTNDFGATYQLNYPANGWSSLEQDKILPGSAFSTSSMVNNESKNVLVRVAFQTTNPQTNNLDTGVGNAPGVARVPWDYLGTCEVPQAETDADGNVDSTVSLPREVGISLRLKPQDADVLPEVSACIPLAGPGKPILISTDAPAYQVPAVGSQFSLTEKSADAKVELTGSFDAGTEIARGILAQQSRPGTGTAAVAAALWGDRSRGSQPIILAAGGSTDDYAERGDSNFSEDEADFYRSRVLKYGSTYEVKQVEAATVSGKTAALTPQPVRLRLLDTGGIEVLNNATGRVVTLEAPTSGGTAGLSATIDGGLIEISYHDVAEPGLQPLYNGMWEITFHTVLPVDLPAAGSRGPLPLIAGGLVLVTAGWFARRRLNA